MWRNIRWVHMTDVENSEILHIWHVCDVENVAIYAKFIAIYAVLLLNLLFTLFCHKISCGEKLSPKVHLWRKNDKYEVCSEIILHPNYIRGKSSQANDIALVTVIKSSP